MLSSQLHECYILQVPTHPSPSLAVTCKKCTNYVKRSVGHSRREREISPDNVNAWLKGAINTHQNISKGNYAKLLKQLIWKFIFPHKQKFLRRTASWRSFIVPLHGQFCSQGGTGNLGDLFPKIPTFRSIHHANKITLPLHLW